MKYSEDGAAKRIMVTRLILFIANQFSKILCPRVYPEVERYQQCTPKLGRDHRVYMHLSHGLLSPYDPKDCISHYVGASSTDHFPKEAIENTLEHHDEWRPSYWSSGGQKDPAVPECLIYSLWSELCLVDEIRIRPLKAFFRFGHPIYSAKHIWFHLGYLKPPLWSETHVYVQSEAELIDDSNYIWTYTSPEFSMLQETVMQSFKLPHSVLCIGGVVKIELLGRDHKDTFDGVYYICLQGDDGGEEALGENEEALVAWESINNVHVFRQSTMNFIRKITQCIGWTSSTLLLQATLTMIFYVMSARIEKTIGRIAFGRGGRKNRNHDAYVDSKYSY